MDEKLAEEKSSANSQSFFNNKSLKDMLDESEESLRRTGAPHFLKTQVSVTSTEQNSALELDLVRGHQLQILRDLMVQIPERMARNEERTQDMVKEVQLLLATIKAQQDPILLRDVIRPKKNKFELWAIVVPTLIAVFFGFLLAKQKTPAPVSVQETAAPTMMEIVRSRANLRESPELKSKVLKVIPPNAGLLKVQSQGEWVQVLFKDVKDGSQTLGWVHQTNLLN